MDKKTLEEQWIEYVKQWNHERFGVAEYLGGRQKTLEETMGYMVAIDEYLEEENITFPFEQTYSSQ
ncbi:MAG: hypothetical protein FWC00_06250, partial [Firmicutes bacterium]|nr:hypothetical protein [Bacillota bacterium]